MSACRPDERAHSLAHIRSLTHSLTSARSLTRSLALIFARHDPQVTNRPNVFSVGDIAASDPGRTTARNNGWALVGHNLSAYFTGRSLRRYRPPPYRWGSLLGPWDGRGFQVFTQWGWSVYVPLALWARFWPLVQRFLWAGMRNSVDWSAWCPPEK